MSVTINGDKAEINGSEVFYPKDMYKPLPDNFTPYEKALHAAGVDISKLTK